MTPVDHGHGVVQVAHAVPHSKLCTIHLYRPPIVSFGLRPAMVHAAPVSQAQSCVYNIPLALDHTLLHTHGPVPHFAKNRNAHLIANCKQFIVGPMPAQQFIDYFLPPPLADDRSDMLASLDAFKSVPLRGIDASDIYNPLASSFFYPSTPCF